MSFADQYLARQNLRDKIEFPPHPDLRYAVVIPCFDEPGLLLTLNSLWDCERPDCPLEVIVVVNSPADAEEGIRSRNQATIAEIRTWRSKKSDPGFRVHILHEPNLPPKYAGAGLARKTGMDEAVCRYNSLDRPEGIILSMDADCTVESNYFIEIEQHFDRMPETRGCTICFEHPVSGEEFPPEVYRAVAAYELHLRYYIQAVRNTRFPHAFHTVGSCFGVTAETYARQGGMNKRKGGEDFYFLQKIIPLGDFHEINSTCVYPSPRPSGRVPFGTGPVVMKYMENGQEMTTYHPESFHALELLFRNTDLFFRADIFSLERYLNRFKADPSPALPKDAGPLVRLFDRLPVHLISFLLDDFTERLAEMNAHCASLPTFRKRFFRWFNMFRILKYLHFTHDTLFRKLPVSQASARLLDEMGLPVSQDINELLAVFRKLQKQVL